MSHQKSADPLGTAITLGLGYTKKFLQPKPVTAGSVAPQVPGGNLQSSKPVMSAPVKQITSKPTTQGSPATSGKSFKAAAAKKLLQIYKQADENAKDSSATRKQKPPAAKDVVDMDKTTGTLADLLTPGSFGGDRAGRSTALARASGQDAPFSVRHPLIGSLPYSVVGSVGGGLLGGVGGGLLDAAAGRTGGPDNSYPAGAAIGMGLGAVTGGVTGRALAGLLRRQQMKSINSGYDAAAETGDAHAVAPKFDLAATVLPLRRGSHRMGELAGAKQIAGEPDHRGVRLGLNASRATGVASFPVGYAQQIYAAIEAADLSKRLAKQHKQAAAALLADMQKIAAESDPSATGHIISRNLNRTSSRHLRPAAAGQTARSPTIQTQTTTRPLTQPDRSQQTRASRLAIAAALGGGAAGIAIGSMAPRLWRRRRTDPTSAAALLTDMQKAAEDYSTLAPSKRPAWDKLISPAQPQTFVQKHSQPPTPAPRHVNSDKIFLAREAYRKNTAAAQDAEEAAALRRPAWDNLIHPAQPQTFDQRYAKTKTRVIPPVKSDKLGPARERYRQLMAESNHLTTPKPAVPAVPAVPTTLTPR